LIWSIEDLKECVEWCYCWESNLEYMWKLMEESMKLVGSKVTEFKKEKLLKALQERNEKLWSCAYRLLQDIDRVDLEISRCQLDLYLEKENSHIQCGLDFYPKDIPHTETKHQIK